MVYGMMVEPMKVSLGLKYHELEEAMINPNSINRAKYETIRKQNLHKMEPIPVCKIPN